MTHKLIVLVTTGMLLSLAASCVAAAPQTKPETRSFPGNPDWVFTSATPDGSLTLSTKSNDGKRVPFDLICQRAETDGGLRVSYSVQFQPPELPAEDPSGSADFRFRVSHVWNPHFGHDFGPVSVQDNRAQRVWVPRTFVNWLLFSQSCHPGARRNCVGNFQIQTRPADADPAKPQEGSTTIVYQQPPRSAGHLFSNRCASLGAAPHGPATPPQ